MSKPMQAKIFRNTMIAGLFLVLVLAPVAAQEALKWLWKMEGEVYTAGQFEKDYESFLALASSQLNIPLSKLKLYLEPESGDSEQLQKLREQMSRENFADNFKTVLLVNRLAGEEGYLKDPAVKDRREFFLKYFTAQIYMMEYLEKNLPVIPEREVMDRWVQERKKDPKLKSITIEEGLKWTRETMEREKMAEMKNELIKKIYKKYKVEENPVSAGEE